MGLHTNRRKGMQPADAAADPPADEDDHAVEVDDFSASQKNLEIVGPQHLSQFLRTALLCSDTNLPWNYHVTAAATSRLVCARPRPAARQRGCAYLHFS